jgi:hypothetical protein
MFSCFGRSKKSKSKAVVINCNTDEQNIQTLVNKLKKGNKQAMTMPEDELLDWAKSLSVKTELIEWYLNPDFASTLETVRTLDNNSNLDRYKNWIV